MKSNIALIGFMGTGKTAAGRMLADMLGRDFYELDSLIEQKAGMTIPDIFQREGEIAFRELEIAVTKEVSRKKSAVIACGGGIVLNRINIDRLREEGITIYLTASPGVILKRTSDDNGRPLLQSADREETIKNMIRFRRPFYERAADITVNTSRMSIEATARKIIQKVKDYESYNR